MRGDGSVFRRRDSSRWWIQFCVRGKVCREVGGRTEAEARKKLKARIREIQAGRFVGFDAERLTVAEELDSFEAWLEAQGKKSAVTIRSHLKPVRAAFGERPVVSLRASDFERYQAERLKAGMAKQTIDHELGALRAALRRAQKQERLSRVPFVPMFRPDNRRSGFFERADFEAVAANLPDPLADVARFGYASGWRRGEIIGLRWEQIDRSAREARLYTSKTGRGRVLPLEGALWQIIERRSAERQFELPGGQTALSPFVFHRLGRPVGDFRKAWTAACAKANVPGRIFHDLRRTAVRDMVRAGVPQSVAMSLSGHRTVSVFIRYDIASEKDKRAALRATEAHRDEVTAETHVAPFSRELTRN
jgi:integrase